MNKETVDNVTQDGASSTITQEENLEEEPTGYLQNVRAINNHTFTFDLQTKNSAKRFICFSPEKRALVDDKNKSPVKIKRTKLSKGKGKHQDYILQSESVIVDDSVDYDPIDYSCIQIAQLHLVPDGSLINIKINVMSKVSSKVIGGKQIDTYSVGDATAACKLTVWERCAEIECGKSYELVGIRVQKDAYGSFGLTTPQKGFSVNPLIEQINVEHQPVLCGTPTALHGEISLVKKVTKYKVKFLIS